MLATPKCVMIHLDVSVRYTILVQEQKGPYRLTKLQSPPVHLPTDPTGLRSSPQAYGTKALHPSAPPSSLLPSLTQAAYTMQPKSPKLPSYRFNNPGRKRGLTLKSSSINPRTNLIGPFGSCDNRRKLRSTRGMRVCFLKENYRNSDRIQTGVPPF